MGTSFVFATSAASSRARSEDRAEVFAYEDSLIVVVADGAGGVAGGAVASDALVDAVRARIGERPFDPYDIRAWSDVLIAADADLARGKNTGETTAIVVVVGFHGVVGVSVGDSEAWVVGQRHDRLTEKQDRARVGTGRSRPTPFHRRSLEGVLLVATDGLFKNARGDSITARCTGDVSDIAKKLVELPRLRSGAYPDDVAVVVVTIPRTTSP
ncbi:MAG TPA: protein phosphatase 2C domain-containing protein [Labilithrix sp.]|nr:protein phosphatase 2C domain-containing protein [Labilithrix sp.]